MEDCGHPSISKGVCTSCGLCVESEYDYVSSYTPCTSVIPKKKKYLAADESRRYNKSVESLVNILNIPGYSDEITHLLQTKDFKQRIGINDKVLAVAYNVLKRHQYPISYSDLQPFTEKTRLRLKRILLREFEYIEPSLEYLTAVFQRVKDFCLSHGFRGSHALEDFISISRSNRCVNPHSLCVAYFIRNENLQDFHKRFNLEKIISISSLRRIVKKMQENLPERENAQPSAKRRLRVKYNAKKYFIGMLQRQSWPK
ncbi:hypothetical protein [Encephalitozoon cuniculi GB-M1]|uniref:Uncharacterized protein n=2 Tax=Encephalitozoon cuniculi TaxID=6035 RepID=Q8SVR7_ENCCU|nr:uncharacterized protein ECU04_1350 [Encephalitozoon cuniculi GB-M1]AGE95280.1 hypothetical protein ECU04_1350 [Encephalitozoon cuniculi]KMV66338.1 hypothetical protein M970_041300 [Encephalitozoon cuniculi EcunIII-L]CAD25323.1 hypothetical protein [Encephalitozoon cuniculi GB-M1]